LTTVSQTAKSLHAVKEMEHDGNTNGLRKGRPLLVYHLGQVNN
jgi:hypothetical protein